MFAPSATVPTQEAMPGLLVGALELRRHDLVQRIARTVSRRRDVHGRLAESALNATRFTAVSTRPATSVAWNCTKWLPVENPLSGPSTCATTPRRRSCTRCGRSRNPAPSSPVSVTVGDAYQPFCAAGLIEADDVGFARST